MDGNYTLSDIAAVTDGNRNNGGMFGGNGDWGAWIILFLLFGMFGRGGWVVLAAVTAAMAAQFPAQPRQMSGRLLTSRL